MKIARNSFAAIFLTALLTSLVFPTMASAAPAPVQPLAVKTEEKDGWYWIESELVTVLFPAGGRKPMFLWWYKNDTSKIYVAKFQGLIEYFTFAGIWYRTRHRAQAARFHELFIKPRLAYYEHHGPMWKLRLLRELWPPPDLYPEWTPPNWHPPLLPFSASSWNLTDWGNVTRGGEVIGIKFNFTLVQAPPRFKFAENNITIRCRFYYKQFTEQVDNFYNYTVERGELKMDLVVNRWKWNIDTVRPLLLKLEQFGITIPEAKPKLALWVNLASIPATKLNDTMNDPEHVEDMSTASHMMIEDKRVFVKPNNTQTEEEKPILVQKKLWEHVKVRLVSSDTTLAGFFKFVSSAKVTDPITNDTEVKNVTATYIEAGAHMRLFICYPYFGNGTLEHDPSLGIEVVLPLVTPPLVIALVGAVSIIAVVVFVAGWRRKIINFFA